MSNNISKPESKRKPGPKPGGSTTRWFRLHVDILTNPKIIRMDDNLFTGWVKLMALASKTEGALPVVPDIALWLRKSEKDTDDLINELIERRFIDIMPDGSLKMHDWDDHQYVGLSSTERSRKSRARKNECNGIATELQRNPSVSVSVSENYNVVSSSAQRQLSSQEGMVGPVTRDGSDTTRGRPSRTRTTPSRVRMGKGGAA